MPDEAQVENRPESTLTAKRDFRQEVTNQIIEMLERGTAPWQKPWEPGALQLPFNPTSGRSYRGGNALNLMVETESKGYNDPRWLTYRQAQEQGWQVRKGEKSSQIEFWQMNDTAQPEEGLRGELADGERAGRSYNGPVRRVYSVFNASQIDGIPPYSLQRQQEWEIAEAGENILANSGAQIRHDQNDRAFYDRSQDTIHLPPKDAFKSAGGYYSTGLHELAHWTGHPSRLNRPTLNESYRFGDTSYAKEELRAELASVFLAAERGIPHNPEQHAAYVASWIDALSKDKHEIFRAARDAHKAADFILDLEKAKTAEKPLAQLRTETSEHVADFERGSSTVNLIEKESAIEHREAVPAAGKRRAPDRDQDAKIDAEKILDGEVDGRKPPSEREFAQSLTAAERQVKDLLGEKAQLYPADADSGKYRGEVLAQTEHHAIQKISARGAVAHAKHLLPQNLLPGQNLVVAYSNGLAEIKPNKARERFQVLSR
jgi:antirestriction protein ArdC